MTTSTRVPDRQVPDTVPYPNQSPPAAYPEPTTAVVVPLSRKALKRVGAALVATAVVGASVGLGAGGIAVYHRVQRYNDEVSFVTALANEGVHGDRGLLVGEAHQLCTGMRKLVPSLKEAAETGNPFVLLFAPGVGDVKEVYDTLESRGVATTDDELGAFIGVSARKYCPDVVTELKQIKHIDQTPPVMPPPAAPSLPEPLPIRPVPPPAPSPPPQRTMTSVETLNLLVDQDRSFVTNVLQGHWVAQLSSKRIGTRDDGIVYNSDDILAEHRRLRDDYGAVLSTKDGYWVTLAPFTFDNHDAAQNWCTAAHRDYDHCFAAMWGKTEE